MPTCKVSICLTTYNRAETLPLTIESILGQSYKDFELIISDDNSTDSTRKVCLDYCNIDSRVSYFRNLSNLKMPGNLNAAISRASGMYIANLHDGDVYKVDLIQKWFLMLQKYPDALFVFNEYNFLNERGDSSIHYRHNLSEINEGSVLMDYFLRTHTSGPWGTVMARTSAYKNYGGFNEKYGFISDVEMWLRLGLNGKVAYVSEPLIDLIPREKHHPYFLPHWKLFCLNTEVLVNYYSLYLLRFPELGITYPVKSLLKKVELKAFRNLITLLKHGQITRIREGIYVFRKLALPKLKWFARFFSIVAIKPVGYINEVVRLSTALTNLKK